MLVGKMKGDHFITKRTPNKPSRGKGPIANPNNTRAVSTRRNSMEDKFWELGGLWEGRFNQVEY